VHPIKAPGRVSDDPAVKVRNQSSGRAPWLLSVIALLGTSVATSTGPLGDRRWDHPVALFVLVTVVATLCIAAATIVIAIADRRELAETGLLGTALMAASVMPLVHGLTTPDVLYDATPAFRLSAFLALPVAVAVATPLLLPHSTFGRWAARRWRDWTLLALLGVFVLAAFVVFFPDAIPAPGSGDPLTVVVSVAATVAVLALSLRQLRFFGLGGQAANLVASLSLVALSAFAVIPLVDDPYSASGWWLHAAGAAGVLGVSVGLFVARAGSRTTAEVLAPVLARDPLVAFELGLSPVVHRFVASLEDKDQITRDHVVRTAETAIRVGERFRMPARDLRNLGLAALLHDVGKLNIPVEVLTKPASLTSEEYELVKRHTIDGEEMLAAEPTLAEVAPIVRSHHERVDGRGYPDGLSGDDIPLASRIIAVCDAFDAMTHDRQYRPAMSLRVAFAVLREHAGTQWDGAVIDQLLGVLPTIPGIPALDEVGRRSTDASALPDDVHELLTTVDAEI
jgi:HD-GYP domain-containing protein (c-di-GMP phosphodiesterase class II)